MARKATPPVFKAGQVLPGQAYTPKVWNPLDPRVRTLLAYLPRKNEAEFANHREVIIDLVLRIPFLRTNRDRQWIGTLHTFWTWAEHHHYATTPESLLCGDRIDDFVNEAYATNSTKKTHRSRLRNVAAIVFPPPVEQYFSRNETRPPHTVAERGRFMLGAAALICGHYGQSPVRRELHRNVIAILALTFGAGCPSNLMNRVEEGWLRVESDGLWLYRPDRRVPTPVEEPWAQLLLNTCSGNPKAWLIRPKQTTPRSAQAATVIARARHLEPTLVGFDADQAARRWHVDLLNAADFDVLAAVCGYRTSTQAANALQPFLKSQLVADMKNIVRGWVK